eukprot:TRINITY_DN2200_c0_g1_i12.p1 TRINITY_DN2200_c0_g1~~TRINITY_DN2200_c0_g1_i12.p1  ORF type:complete len:1009 (+),score=228.31 TRINITY_DN2200_c0_g1_i12:124-3150(+)
MEPTPPPPIATTYTPLPTVTPLAPMSTYTTPLAPLVSTYTTPLVPLTPLTPLAPVTPLAPITPLAPTHLPPISGTHPTPLPPIGHRYTTSPYSVTSVGSVTSTSSVDKEGMTFAAMFNVFLSQKGSEKNWELLYELYEAFLNCSVQYARTIISERGLQDSDKTIKPKSNNSTPNPSTNPSYGTLGGPKFLINGIMFKYCDDVQVDRGTYILGGDSSSIEKAIKLGSHELKGGNILLSSACDELRVTLISVVNYSGYRMIAMAELPGIAGTLPKHGSCDGGKHFNWDEKVSGLLADVGTKLNLLPHTSVSGDYTIQVAADVEVHYVKDFDHHYVLDLSRLMPPDPCHESGSHYYYFFRPEFIKKLPFPVASEVGNFIIPDEKEITIWTIKTAQKSLRASIQDYANKLIDPTSTHAAYQFASSHQEMCYQLHLHGINLRYMGLLVCDLEAIWKEMTMKKKEENEKPPTVYEHCIDILCIEMIARTLKCMAHEDMRTVRCSTPHEDTKKIKEVMVKIMNYGFEMPSFEGTLKNKFFKDHHFAETVKDITKIQFKEKYATIYEKMVECYNQTRSIEFQTPDEFISLVKGRMGKYKNSVISRLIVLANWKVDKEIMELFDRLHRKDINNNFTFKILNIRKISPYTKYLGCVDYANAKFQLDLLKKVPFHKISKDHQINLDKIITLLKSSIYKSFETPDVWLTLMETTIEYLRFNFDVHYIEWIISSWVKNLLSFNDSKLMNTTTFLHSFLLHKINLRTKEGENILSTLKLKEQDCIEWAQVNLQKLFLYCKNIDSNSIFRRSLSHFSKLKEGDIWKYFTFCSKKINSEITFTKLKEICSSVPSHLQLQSAPDIIVQMVNNLQMTARLTLNYIPAWVWYGRTKKPNYYSPQDSKEIEEVYKEWKLNPTHKMQHKLSNTKSSISTLAPLGHDIIFSTDSDGTEKRVQRNRANQSDREIERKWMLNPHKVMRYAIIAKSLALLKEVLPCDDVLVRDLTDLLETVTEPRRIQTSQNQ